MRWVLGLAILLSIARAQAGELREVRLLDSPEATRVVFDLDARADNNVFTLANPDRVVIDIDSVKKGHNLKLNLPPTGVVKGVRSGPHDGGLRVVLDLNGPVTPKSFGLQPSGGYGYRLILDLVHGGAPAMVTADAAPAAPATAVAAATAPPAPVEGGAAAMVPAVALAMAAARSAASDWASAAARPSRSAAIAASFRALASRASCSARREASRRAF